MDEATLLGNITSLSFVCELASAHTWMSMVCVFVYGLGCVWGQARPPGVLLYQRPPCPLETYNKGTYNKTRGFTEHLTHSQSVTLCAVSGTQR